MLTEDIKHYASKSVLCWLATVSAKGQPNVSPKELFVTEHDTHVLIANVASPTSVRNIRENPRVCVSFIDIFVQKGYKLQGIAELIPKTDARFAGRVLPLRALAGDAFPIHTIMAVRITDVAPIIAPGYRYTSATEASQTLQAYRAYGVRHKDPDA